VNSRRAADLTTRWVRWYTRRLPAPVAERRIGEIGADLHDHIAFERERGTDDRRIALSVLSRLVRGLTADAAWRNRNRPWIGALMRTFAIAAVVAVLGIAAIVLGGYDDSPGLQGIGLLMVLGALFVSARKVYRRRRQP
jgi:hypothetical protein